MGNFAKNWGVDANLLRAINLNPKRIVVLVVLGIGHLWLSSWPLEPRKNLLHFGLPLRRRLQRLGLSLTLSLGFRLRRRLCRGSLRRFTIAAAGRFKAGFRGAGLSWSGPATYTFIKGPYMLLWRNL